MDVSRSPVMANIAPSSADNLKPNISTSGSANTPVKQKKTKHH